MSPEPPYSSPYPTSIRRRREELEIRRILDQVKNDHVSRAVLLYGPGGVGKTSLVRRMAEANRDLAIEWLDPIDVDDSHYWLLSNLEEKVTKSLASPDEYFDPYKEQLSQLPDYTRNNINRETVVSYLGRIKEIFAQCYSNYVENENKTVVIIFDTVETIRDTNLLSTLTQWMKALPKSTLFILSGRPVSSERTHWRGRDPIEAELNTPHRGISVVKVEMEGFMLPASRNYIAESIISEALVGDQKDNLIYLAQGQPLWLAFAIDYLVTNGIPDQALNSLEYLKEHMPYGGVVSPEGNRLYQAFLRTLVAPYRNSDFWHEAIKRLAVVRQPIDRAVWRMLMDDLDVPGPADLDATWDELLRLPWIRSRGNGRYVTLHDAVAEAFAQRLFPLHDPDQRWRHRVWQRAQEIYDRLAAEKEHTLQPKLTALNQKLNSREGRDSEIIARTLEVDALKRELDELRASGLYYLSLTDFGAGCRVLLQYLEQASKERDLFIQDLLILYLQRFLPGGTPSGAFDDVIKAKLDEFRGWLVTEGQDYYVAIVIAVATYFLEVAQPQAALALLNQLLNQLFDYSTGAKEQYRVHILCGNACMRIPSEVDKGISHFSRALRVAENLPAKDRTKLIAEAYKERGFYYRNIGDWDRADQSYKTAQDTLLLTGAAGSNSAGETDEIASIKSNWAYVKGLAGQYAEGANLAEAAVETRRQSAGPVEVGISLSVCGEVYRYAKEFDKAWDNYASAEHLLNERPNWSWLGLIYQEQAICLYQAQQRGKSLTEDPTGDAKRLVTRAMDICRSHAIRGYPSALNRAGRIYGHENPVLGLPFLEMGIIEARRLSDGWFLLANLVEYAEHCYRAWTSTRESEYRYFITRRTREINTQVNVASPEGRFPDLTGRWRLLQGHLGISDYLYNNDEDALADALEYYKIGFPAIAERPVASSGDALIPGEFEKFEQLFRQLPPPVRTDWQTKLAEAWHDSGSGSALLLTQLHKLRARLR